MAPRRGNSGLKDMGLFEEFLSLARLHKGYVQHFCTADLYAMDLIEDRQDMGVAEVAALWRRYRAGLPDGKINLYLTTPYCFRECSYCLFFKEVPSCAGDLEVYKDRLIALAGAFAPLFKELEFENLFFGGGTPSLFTEKQLAEICGKVVSRLKVFKDGSRTFECEPLTVNHKKLEIAAKAGFNRVSVGVQSLDRGVLKVLNRDYQGYPMVKRFLDSAHALGFKEINVDLMIGVHGDAPEVFVDGFRRVMELRPTTIAVYQVVPNQDYLDRWHGGSKEKFFAYSLAFRKKVFRALARLAAEHGYVCPRLEKFCMANKMAGSVVFQDRKIGVKQEYSLNEIGPEDSYFTLGHRGDSYVPNVAFYQTTPLAARGRDNIFKVTPLAGRRAMEFYCLRKLSSYNDLYREDFRRLFKKDLLEVFPEEIGQFVKAGRAKVLKDRIVFGRSDIKTRFLIAMVFIGRERILARVNAWLKERRVELRFGEFSYGAFAEYDGGRLAFGAEPLPGSKRSELFERMIRGVFAEIKPGRGLADSVGRFEAALRRLQEPLRRRFGVGVR